MGSSFAAFLGSLRGSLKASKASAASAAVHVVLGNEACDLDSAVSALAYAYRLSQAGVPSPLPVLNVPRKDFPTKTEVVYAFRRFLPKELGHTAEEQASKLVFVDELDLKGLAKAKRLNLTLVDHHFLAPSQSELGSSVRRVVDHHARHEPSLKDVPAGQTEVRTVGSCASLVAGQFQASSQAALDSEPALGQLLRATVLLDTKALSPEIFPPDKSVDEAALLWLESRLPAQGLPDRAQLTRELTEARADIASLSPSQVLRKDLKTLLGDGGLRIGVPTVRALLGDFVVHVGGEGKLLGALEAFAEEDSLDGVVVLLSARGKRQILVFAKDEALRARLRAAIPESLRLSAVEPQGPWAPKVAALEQGDPSLTRKAVLPALTRAFVTEAKPAP